MQKTQPVSRDSQIFETLNYKDDSIQVQDLDFFGPWHKQNNSIQQQIAQIRKTYTSSTNHIQNEIIERPETQNSQVRMINTSFPNKRRKTRKISIDQSSQFIEKPKYNESRQVQKIIQDFFIDENKEKKKKQRNYAFFIPQASKSNNNTKCNGSSFQTTQAYFDVNFFIKLRENSSKNVKIDTQSIEITIKIDQNLKKCKPQIKTYS
ncbi:unnamed protein product [Paramecium primaurelia]|uniref:Uncharacterized protein n=1 Tax=Paramecium primaurelia TaxID=5886 RepID=A0A8S1N466_PARPR|nr:unnamed protein product [Paramecium primaurelia]